MICNDPFLLPISPHAHKFFLKKIAKNSLYIVCYHKSKGWSLIIKCIPASRSLAEEINKKELLVLPFFFFQNNTQRKYDNRSWRQVRKGRFNWAEAWHEQSVWLIHGSLYCLGTLFPSLLDQIKEKHLWTFCLPWNSRVSVICTNLGVFISTATYLWVLMELWLLWWKQQKVTKPPREDLNEILCIPWFGVC